MTSPDTPQPYYQPDPYGQPPQWAPPTPPTPSKKKGGVARWLVPVGVGVAALLIGVGIGGAGGSTAQAGDKAAAPKPGATVTATATQSVVSTVTATPPAPTATVTETFTPTPAVAFTDGLMAVGTDVQPGTYHTDGAGGSCYWARLSSLSPTDIIANNLSAGPQTINVAAGDAALMTRGGCSWTAVG